MNFLVTTTETWNSVVYGLEIVAIILAFVIVIIGLLQGKQAQTGLAALNGGNDELFMNVKERGFEKLCSRLMTYLGLSLFLIGILIAIFTNVFL